MTAWIKSNQASTLSENHAGNSGDHGGRDPRDEKVDDGDSVLN